MPLGVSGLNVFQGDLGNSRSIRSSKIMEGQNHEDRRLFSGLDDFALS